MSIERYDCNSEMYHSHYGSFVRFDDHEAELAALRERVARLVGALEAITRRVPIMASTGEYRTGQLHALEACAEVARTALEDK